MNEVNSIMRAALKRIVDLDLLVNDCHPDGPDTNTIRIHNFASLCEVIESAENAIAEAEKEDADAADTELFHGLELMLAWLLSILCQNGRMSLIGTKLLT